jgi:hypothetical protein
MRKKIFVMFAFCVFSFSLAQNAPAPLESTNDNKILIDNMIKIADFDKYVHEYCRTRIYQTAARNNWNETRTQQAIANIDKVIKFEEIKNSIYNTFAQFSTDDLSDINKLFKKLKTNKYNKTNFFLMNDILQSNLELNIEELIISVR